MDDYSVLIELLSEALQDEMTFQNLLAGETLFNPNEEAVALFIVETGRIKLISHTSEEETSTIEIIRSGEIVGETALFSDVYDYQAIANIDSRVIVCPKQPLLLAFSEKPELAKNLIAILIKKNQTLKFHLELLNIRSAHERVFLYLNYLNKSSKTTTINLDRPFKDIADYLNITAETLSRVLSRLTQEGVITRRERNTIVLHYFSSID